MQRWGLVSGFFCKMAGLIWVAFKLTYELLKLGGPKFLSKPSHPFWFRLAVLLPAQFSEQLLWFPFSLSGVYSTEGTLPSETGAP